VNVHGLSPMEAAEAGIEELYRWTDDVHIPSMEELGSPRTISRCSPEWPSRTHKRSGNPREVTVADYEEIYRTAFSRGD
jgi:choline dehydrogenase